MTTAPTAPTPRRPRPRGGRLGRKLTLSYTLVSVAAALLFMVLALALLTQTIVAGQVREDAILAGLDRLAPGLTRTLTTDAGGVGAWLASPRDPTTGGPPPRAFPAAAGGTRLVVLDATGTAVFAGDAEGASATPPERLRRLASDALDADAALPTRRYGLASVAGARPLATPEGRTVGAVAAAATPNTLSPPLLIAMGGFLTFVTVVVALVGTVFGLLVARPLVRRLERLAAAADGWSRGDFSVLARDRSGDELGQLGRRLDRMAGQLRSLVATRQELAALEERQRLARDLHDAVKGQIFASGMQLGAAKLHVDADPARARRHLEAAEALLGEAQRELADLVGQLRPAALEERGLGPALRAHARAWAEREGVALDLDVDAEGAPPREVETALFRVAQEALANVARHADAARVGATLARDGGGLRLEVRDDGRGFDPAAAEGAGVGLASMRERIEALDGRLRIDARPGGGTRIVATVPVEAPEASR